jgi:hypothetical protein
MAGIVPLRSARAQIDEAGEDRVAAATVLIVALVVELEDGIPTKEYWRVPLGSGVVVSADGLILTNSHVVDLTALKNDVENEENTQGVDLEIEDAFLIYAVDGMGDDPNPQYSATKIVDRQNLDLAVLSVTGNERGLRLSRPVGADRSPVALGPSGDVNARDLVHIFGYPVFGREAFADIGGTTIDVVDGRVRSLETGPGIGNIQLIHIDATVSQGSSGGAVVDEYGQLIGIMTEARGGAAGGSAAVAIPINRARTVLEAAGWVEPPPTSGPTPTTTPEAPGTPEPASETPPPPTPTPAGPVAPTPTATPTATPDPQTLADAARFAELLARRGGMTPLAGPLAGDLVQDDAFISLQGASLTTADFSASATFVNPTVLTGKPWDFGFMFHRATDTSRRIVVDSNGTWYYTPYPEGTLETGFARVNSAPGGTNTLDLIVEGTTALFGVNGQFVTRIDLPPAIPSDILAGTGFFVITTEQGRTVSFKDFTVWPLQVTPTPQATVTPTSSPTATPVSPPSPSPARVPALTPTPVSIEDMAHFTELLAARDSSLSLAGPFSASLAQQTGFSSVNGAGLFLENFSARATFVNPTETTGTPWDFGFTFHESAEVAQQIVVDSTGYWYYTPYPAGTLMWDIVPGLDIAPGATNTLDLIVEGTTALFGVNGQLVARIDLPAPIASDIKVGTGYFTNTIVPGRTVPYSDFTVWPIAATAAPTTAPFPTAPPLAPDTPTAEIDETLRLGFQALVLSASLLPATGPFAGELIETSMTEATAFWPGVSLAEFGASATFANPDTTTTPADMGFEFHNNGTVYDRVIMDNRGNVYAVVAAQQGQPIGQAATFDTSPGATNTLQIFVGDASVFVGVNGEYVASVNLLPDAAPADISVGTNFFAGDFVQDRVTRFTDFKIWDMEDSPNAVADGSPAGTPSATVALPGSDTAEMGGSMAEQATLSGADVPMLRGAPGRTGELTGPGPLGDPTLH